jgi:hypothetical protein
MNTEKTHQTGPPIAPLAFRVGIVGHRPDRLESSSLPILKDLMGSILKAIKDGVEQTAINRKHLYSDDPPVLRAVSPLAEGADRIFAEQAILQGFELSCPMPFAQEEFENDFVPPESTVTDSLKDFHRLLALAEKTTRLVKFDLDGNRTDENEAYRNNGQIVLNQSDLLFVIWDGISHYRKGGTEETFYSAIVQQIPVIWIDACAPHLWEIIHPGQAYPEKDSGNRNIPSGRKTRNDIIKLVSDVLAIHDESVENLNNQMERIAAFYRERQPHLNFALLWKYFRNLTGDTKISFISPVIKSFNNPANKDSSIDSSPVSKLAGWLQPYYIWPDKLADYYADRYRSGFILTFLLASLAVGTALFPLIAGWLAEGHGKGLTFCIIIESFLILTIIIMVYLTRKFRWYERWLDYRMTAESIRLLKLFLPLGGGKPFPKMAGHLTHYGNPSATWMAWYVQSIERMAGLPSAKIDNNYLEKCLTHFAELLAGQQNYHETNARLYAKIDYRLHKTGELTLWLTLISCLLHLLPVVVPVFHLPVIIGNVFIFLCGFLPALGASMAGINHQGEFKRISKSNQAMSEQFIHLSFVNQQLLTKLQEKKSGKGKTLFNQVKDLSCSIANLMINEVSDWKVVYQDRPPTLPA